LFGVRFGVFVCFGLFGGRVEGVKGCFTMGRLYASFTLVDRSLLSKIIVRGDRIDKGNYIVGSLASPVAACVLLRNGEKNAVSILNS